MRKVFRFLAGWAMFGLMVVVGVVLGLAVLNLIAKLGMGTILTSAAQRVEDAATPEGAFFAA